MKSALDRPPVHTISVVTWVKVKGGLLNNVSGFCFVGMEDLQIESQQL